MQIISTIALYNYKVPVIVKKNNFTFCPGNIFQDFPGLTNKIQGLSRTAKKIQDFPGLFQDVATLHLLYMFPLQFTSTSPVFMQQNTFEKN